MRLTKRDKKLYALENSGKEHWADFVNVSNRDDADEKLCQLEDIEDKLGIDLITLFKALKQGYIYYPIDCPNDCYKYKIECLYMKPRIHLYVADGVGGCYMEDYGKTWALDKNDLTKEFI